MNLVKRSNALSIPSFLDEILRADWYGGTETFTNKVPAVNIKENELKFKVEVYAPGLIKEDFKVEISQKTLTVSSEKQSNTQEGNEHYATKEFSFSSFCRKFNLPDSVNIDEIQANYDNGILTISLPKREEVLPKPKRVIEIK